jgi:hypothetical protein
MNVSLQQCNAIRDKLASVMYDFEHDPSLEPLAGVQKVETMIPIEDSQEDEAPRITEVARPPKYVLGYNVL